MLLAKYWRKRQTFSNLAERIKKKEEGEEEAEVHETERKRGKLAKIDFEKDPKSRERKMIKCEKKQKGENVYVTNEKD